MRFGSVCSGIEAASVAWKPLGWEAAWLSEIEPFPCAVLKHHYPDVPNLGDMTTLPERILSGEVEAPDLFCGGTPCQAFSVAGNRKSLNDARGNLSLTFCEIANAIDTIRQQRGEQPAVIFWENVPGVLNTKDNAFGCFLAELAGETVPLQPPWGRWTDAGCVFGPKRTVAWRVLDAQYFSLAQRRRRVFVVASAGAIDPSEVLFEFDGLRRDTAPSRETRKVVASDAEAGAGGCWWDGGQVAGTLTKEGAGGNQRMPDKGNLGAVVVPAYCAEVSPTYSIRPDVTPKFYEDIAGTIGATDYKDPTCVATVCGQDKFLARPVAFAIQGSMIGRNDDAGPQGDGVNVEISFTQNCADRHAVATNMIVRRLTPIECERLQGFPDGYTNIPYRNKPESPDGPRYKALGNSWAVPVVRWIGERINNAFHRL